LAGEISEYARELHDSAAALVQLVTAVLDLSRLDAGKIDLMESELTVAAILEEEVRQLQPLAMRKNIDLSCHVAQTDLKIRGDRIKLGRVLGNLISNAIKFTPAGSVRVTAGCTADGSLNIDVADNGIGVPVEHQTRIFDEFAQISRSDRNAGAGLGLSISKRLIGLMGGTISVRSEPGRGSTFTVTLPAERVLCSEAAATK